MVGRRGLEPRASAVSTAFRPRLTRVAALREGRHVCGAQPGSGAFERSLFSPAESKNPKPRAGIAFWLLTTRLFGRWPTLRKDAKLSEHTEVVPDGPVLGYLAVDDSVDSHALPRDVSASRRDRSPRRMKDLACVSAGRVISCTTRSSSATSRSTSTRPSEKVDRTYRMIRCMSSMPRLPETWFRKSGARYRSVAVTSPSSKASLLKRRTKALFSSI